MNLKSISDQENKLSVEASTNLGKEYLLCVKFLETTKSIKQVQGFIFPHFLAHIINGFHLCVLSAIRRHTFQSNMILRQVLESSVLAAYSLYNPNPSDFGTNNGTEFLVHNDKVLEKAYKWIEANYLSYSNFIKPDKSLIKKFLCK